MVGLGLLTKPTYLVYVAAPILHQAFAGSRGGERRRRLALLGLAAGIAAVIALPWYGQRIVGMPFQVVDRSFKQAAEADQAALFSWTWLLFYPRVFQPQFGLLAGLACVWGLWALRKDRRARAYLWLATLPALFVFSIIQNRNLRYTLPLLPVAALVATAGIRSFRMPWRRVAVVALVAVAALQVSMTTFAIPPPPTLDVFLTPLVLPNEPMRADWQQQRILDELMRASGGKPATVAVVPNYNFLAVSNLRYEALVRQLPLEVTRAWAGPPLGVDLMVLKTGSQGPSFSAAKPEGIMRAFAGEDPDLATAFPVVAEYPLPDGSQAIIRARRIPPLVGVDPAEVARRLQQAQEAAMADFVRDAVGLRVSLDYRPEAILRGEVDRVRVEAEAATIGELKRRDRAPLRVRDVRIEVDRLLINPQRLMRTGAIEVLDAGELRIDRAVITQADLDALLAGQPIGAWLTVRFTDGWADVKAKGLPGVGPRGDGPGHADRAVRAQGGRPEHRRRADHELSRRLGGPPLRPDAAPQEAARPRLGGAHPDRPAASRSARRRLDRGGTVGAGTGTDPRRDLPDLLGSPPEQIERLPALLPVRQHRDERVGASQLLGEPVEVLGGGRRLAARARGVGHPEEREGARDEVVDEDAPARRELRGDGRANPREARVPRRLDEHVLQREVLARPAPAPDRYRTRRR